MRYFQPLLPERQRQVHRLRLRRIELVGADIAALLTQAAVDAAEKAALVEHQRRAQVVGAARRVAGVDRRAAGEQLVTLDGQPVDLMGIDNNNLRLEAVEQTGEPTGSKFYWNAGPYAVSTVKDHLARGRQFRTVSK